MSTTPPHTLGRIAAALESARVLDKTGVAAAATRPAATLGPAIGAAMQLDVVTAAAIGTLLAEIDDVPDDLAPADAARFWAGYARQQRQPRARRIGAPIASQRVDWTSVDWTQRDADLARALGVTRQTVRTQRIRHAPKV